MRPNFLGYKNEISYSLSIPSTMHLITAILGVAAPLKARELGKPKDALRDWLWKWG